MIVTLGISLSILPTIAIASGLSSNSWASINQWRFGGFGSPFGSRGNQVFSAGLELVWSEQAEY